MSSKAEQFKQQGNAAFLKGQLDLALASYTTAIQLDPSIAAYPLNRSAVYLKQSEWIRAEKDATTALELDGGNNVKALYRRATARRHTGKLELAQQGELAASIRGTIPRLKNLEEAKRQGGGADVDKELLVVLEQLKLGIAQAGAGSGASQPSPNGKKDAAVTQPQNGNGRLSSDRLRAALAEPSTRAATTPPSSASPTGDDLMNAVSTRRLKPTPPPASSPVASDLESAATGASNSFAAKKEARLAKHKPAVVGVAESASRKESVPVSPSASNSTGADPSSPAVAPPVASTSTSAPPFSPSAVPRSVLVSTPPSPAAVSTLLYHTAATSSPTALEAHFLAHPQRGDPVRLAAVREVAQRYPVSATRRSLDAFVDQSNAMREPTKSLRDWMGPAGLTPDLLSELLAEVGTLYPSSPQPGPRDVDDDSRDWVVELLEALPTCQRWDSASLFLADEEKAAIRRVLDLARARVDRIGASWGV